MTKRYYMWGAAATLFLTHVVNEAAGAPAEPHDAADAYGLPWRPGHNSYRSCAPGVANAVRLAVVGSVRDLLKRRK